MTTIITRLYKDEQTANGVAQALKDQKFRSNMLDVIVKGGDTAAQMSEAKVPAGVAGDYADGINGGNALLVVRAPFGAAEKAGILVDETDSLAGDSTYVAAENKRRLKDYILTDHPHIMSSPESPALYPGTKFWANFPIGHLIPGHKFQAGFPFGHLIPGHKFQAGIPFGHLIPGHKFQAGFPFGHLIPGHKFQAKFPFAHLIPGHKFQANFPFGHIVKGHKYMANWIWPHTKVKSS
ncbi:MAG: hypothetical protein AAFV19_05660 [Pseudomonadota bacterium]